MNAIGLDIGGANLKASDGLQQTLTVPFPLWEKPDQLSTALGELLTNFSSGVPLAVTMTGELADCFRSRAEGVREILKAVDVAAAGRPVIVWQTVGEFVSAEEAIEFPSLTAAANWHALATWAGRIAPVGSSLLIDIGSTTTDLIPMEDGVPLPTGRTDFERLQSGELQYLGVRRTPLCALASEVMIRRQRVGIAREFFATTLDVHLWLGLIAEEPHNHNTANGHPCTRAAAADRLARMVCSDLDDLTEEDISEFAHFLQQREIEILQQGLSCVLGRIPRPRSLVLAGEGEFLARQLIASKASELTDVEVFALGSVLGNIHSQGACAFALARLAGERWQSAD